MMRYAVYGIALMGILVMNAAYASGNGEQEMAQADAPQPRIRDLSLTPQEMEQQQFNAPSSSDNYYQHQQYGQPDSGRGGLQRGPLPDDRYNAGPFSQFINGYCDPNFRPAMGNNPQYATAEACLERQKQNACRAFQSLPPDAQRVLEDTVSCIYTTENGDSADNGRPAYNDPACAGNDSRRVRMMKKYWGNEPIMHALVFLPDQVLNASGRCIDEAP